MRFALFLLASGLVELPSIGLVRDESNAVRPILGVRGNFSLGGPIAQNVLSAILWRGKPVVKTDTELLIGGGRYPAPPGPALFALTREAAYIICGSQLLRWSQGSLDSLAFTAPEGEIVDTQVGDVGLMLLVRRGDELWLVSGGAETRLAGVSGAALLQSDGSIRRFPDILSVERISEDWIHLWDGETHFVAAGGDSYQLPWRRL
jgi:hypothetical protein